ncbi:hypothetical protein [Embleya sp. AB8]|uniref:hypothetical protein n=1 Tax=Embleya sp. AB8 TaxID=3156304 RepID=UPI003C7968E6
MTSAPSSMDVASRAVEFPFGRRDFVRTFRLSGKRLGSGRVVDVDVRRGRVTVEMRDGRRASFPLAQVEPVTAVAD